MTLWVRIAAVVGLVTAPLIALAAMMVAAEQFADWQLWYGTFSGLFDSEIGPYVPAIGLGSVILLMMSYGRATSVWARMSVVAVAAQVLAIGFAAALWWTWEPSILGMETHFPLAQSLPVTSVLVVAGAAVCTAALPPRRALPWVRGAVVFLLTQLLALGLMLPFVTRWLPLAWDAYTPAYPACLVLASVAVAFAATALGRRSGSVARHKRLLQIGFGVVLVAGILLMPSSEHPGSFGYSNVAYLMVAESIVVLAGVISFAVLQWRWLRGARPDGELLVGIAEPDEGDVVASVRYRGWLRGMRAESTRFRLRTKRGVVEVPAGSRVVAETPPATALLRAGEAAPVIGAGEKVAVAGMVQSAADGPYRGAMVAGSGGVTVAPAAPPTASALREVVLWVWRPCLLYLAVTTAVALPGVITAATPYDSDRAKYVFVHEPVDWAPERAGALVHDGFMAGECAAREDRPRVTPDDSNSLVSMVRELHYAATCWGLRHAGCPSMWDITPYTIFDTPFLPHPERFEILCNELPPRQLEVRPTGYAFREGPPLPRGFDPENWLSDEERLRRAEERIETRWRERRITEAFASWAEANDAPCPDQLSDLRAYVRATRFDPDAKYESTDAWGNELVFECPVQENGYDFTVRSRGRDGIFKTADDEVVDIRDPRNP